MGKYLLKVSAFFPLAQWITAANRTLCIEHFIIITEMMLDVSFHDNAAGLYFYV